jgi:4a-hydroxytetrahydrobiopterin dehydratase
MNDLCDIASRHCAPCEGGVAPLGTEAATALLAKLDGWALSNNVIGKRFRFANHYETMAFVNGIAWISHREDHHPELTVGYAECHVRYWTHAINGLSENDFICAAKVDRLFAL